MVETSVRHIAIIPDGNRTRATNQGLQTIEGHLAWQQNSFALMQWVFSNTNIDVFTIRWLSTENLTSRTTQELDYLAMIYEQAIEQAAEFMIEKRISLRRIWSPVWMSDRLINVLESAVARLTFETDKVICLGINYGGHDEILRWIKHWYDQWADSTELTKEWFANHLDMKWLPMVDLMVRTKSHLATRLSWYLLRWIAYAELYFTPVLFPDFDVDQLKKALNRFEDVKEYRNFGK